MIGNFDKIYTRNHFNYPHLIPFIKQTVKKMKIKNRNKIKIFKKNGEGNILFESLRLSFLHLAFIKVPDITNNKFFFLLSSLIDSIPLWLVPNTLRRTAFSTFQTLNTIIQIRLTRHSLTLRSSSSLPPLSAPR